MILKAAVVAAGAGQLASMHKLYPPAAAAALAAAALAAAAAVAGVQLFLYIF
jgi:hypothetical protein